MTEPSKGFSWEASAITASIDRIGSVQAALAIDALCAERVKAELEEWIKGCPKLCAKYKAADYEAASHAIEMAALTAERDRLKAALEQIEREAMMDKACVECRDMKVIRCAGIARAALKEEL